MKVFSFEFWIEGKCFVCNLFKAASMISRLCSNRRSCWPAVLVLFLQIGLSLGWLTHPETTIYTILSLVHACIPIQSCPSSELSKQILKYMMRLSPQLFKVMLSRHFSSNFFLLFFCRFCFFETRLQPSEMFWFSPQISEFFFEAWCSAFKFPKFGSCSRKLWTSTSICGCSVFQNSICYCMKLILFPAFF